MFRPGDKKPENSGRKPGTPNKRTTLLVETLDSLEIEPLKKIIDLLPTLEPKEQVDVYLDLIGYIYPKRKATEVSFEEETREAFAPTIEDMKTLIRIARDNPKDK